MRGPIAPATHFELADTEGPGIVGGPTIMRRVGLKPKVLGTTRLQLRKVHLQKAHGQIVKGDVHFGDVALLAPVAYSQWSSVSTTRLLAKL
jgi:hypothetical protein